MAQSGAVEAETPHSRTGETAGTPTTPESAPFSPRREATVTPGTNTPKALSKEDAETVVVEPAVGATSHRAVESGRVEVGGEGERVAESGCSHRCFSKDIDVGLRTAIKPLDYLKFNDHGEPVKEQERVSYQNMLVRYADWSSVRWQFVAYFLLGLIAQIYRGHSTASAMLTQVEMVKDGRHVHCCCDIPLNLIYLQIDYDHIQLGQTMKILLYVVLFLLGGLSPLWERFIGRRNIMLIMMIASIPTSVVLIFIQNPHSQICEFSHFLLSLCGMLAVLVSISSLIEMLPYETRYLSVLICFFSANVTYALAALHFRRGYSAYTLGWGCLIGGVVGAIITRFFLKDSICHLNIRNDVDVIEKIFKKREAELHDDKPEGGSHYHQAVARKIFEDLVYLDQDELKFSEFFKRLWRSFAMIEIALAVLQAISAGVHEFESDRYEKESFEDPMRTFTDSLLGYVLAAILLYFLRKAHRNRAICILLAGLLLNSAARQIIVGYNRENRCGTIPVVYAQFEWLSTILSITASALSSSVEMLIALHFLETTPSILRSTCGLLIYTPVKVAYDVASSMLKDSEAKSIKNLSIIYAFHLAIIIVTMLRTNSRLPFSLYLFDLMPTTDHERDGNCASHEKIRPIMEETAQPLDVTTQKEKNEIIHSLSHFTPHFAPMAQRGAVDAGTPVSRTGETAGTPITPVISPPAVTPLATPAAVTSKVKKEEGKQTGAAVVVAGVSVPPLKAADAGSAEVGGQPARSAEPVDKARAVASQKDVDARLRTAIKPLDFLKINEHGEPVKEQERVSYQNMLVRYADWHFVRWQFLAYFLLNLIAQIYRGHNVAIRLLNEVDTIKEDRHIHCCCDEPRSLYNLQNYHKQFMPSQIMYILLLLPLYLLGLLSPLWERFVGRRNILLIFMIICIPASGILMLVQDTASLIVHLSHNVLHLCGILSMMVVISTLIEMFPYEIRYLAVLNCYFGSSITVAIAGLHFRRGYHAFNLGMTCMIGSALGAIITRFFTRDSICHLNIRNEVDKIEKIFKKREDEFHVEKREGVKGFHRAVAKKIFEDLVYLDQDELSFSQFFKRLWRSFAMIEIGLAFFQAISVGFHDFGTNYAINERFDDPLKLLVDTLLGYALAGLLMHLLRKAHRSRSICFLLAGLLLVSIVRHALVGYTERNKCATIHLVAAQFAPLSMIMSTTASAFTNAAIMMISLHFFETTPSILRSTCALLIYMPIKIVYTLSKKYYSEHVTKDLDSLLPVYIYHVIIIVLTMLRTNSKLPFNLYLFDLMPQNELDRTNRASHEKLRLMPEESAQPPTHVTTEGTTNTTNTNLDDNNLMIPDEKRGKKSEKRKLSLGRALKSIKSIRNH